jgi:hypothetical protein
MKCFLLQRKKHRRYQAEYLVELFLEVGWQIPYSHPAQNRLVELLKRLSYYNRLIVHNKTGTYWDSMHPLVIPLREWYPCMFIPCL